MSAFELRDRMENNDMVCDKKKMDAIDEPIITFKIYDSCRIQDCCTSESLGPVRVAKAVKFCDLVLEVGDVVIPPPTASTVTMENLIIKDTMILSKVPSPFKKGYWDIDLKYVYEFDLVFRKADGTIIGTIKSNIIYNKKLCLFGSMGTDLVLYTDLFIGAPSMLQADPFVLIEAKAVPQSAEIKYCKHHKYTEIKVSIGLFSIVKLFRIVDLMVESKGFAIPRHIKEHCPVDPCEYFGELDFPMDIFSPPQMPEFLAGISGNIPNNCYNTPKPDHPKCNCKCKKDHCNCNCGCNCH